MRFGTTPPAINAELDYRRAQIAHDFAVAHGWELSVRRLAGRIRRKPARRSPEKNNQLVAPGRLGWR